MPSLSASDSGTEGTGNPTHLRHRVPGKAGVGSRGVSAWLMCEVWLHAHRGVNTANRKGRSELDLRGVSGILS